MLVDREGTFRAECLEYGLQTKDSGSVSVVMRCMLTAYWNADAEEPDWEDYTPYGMEVTHYQWIIGKEGKPLEKGIEALVRHAGWNGSFKSIQDESWQPKPFQLVIREEQYKGNSSLKSAFLNGFDDTPGAGIKKADAATIQNLEARFGSQMRAVVGNVKLESNKPAGKPPAPKPNKRPEPVAANGGTDDDIPF